MLYAVGTISFQPVYTVSAQFALFAVGPPPKVYRCSVDSYPSQDSSRSISKQRNKKRSESLCSTQGDIQYWESNSVYHHLTYFLLFAQLSF